MVLATGTPTLAQVAIRALSPDLLLAVAPVIFAHYHLHYHLRYTQPPVLRARNSRSVYQPINYILLEDDGAMDIVANRESGVQYWSTQSPSTSSNIAITDGVL